MTITLSSDLFAVTITPDRGADITQIEDLKTGLPLLSVAPTAQVTNPRLNTDNTMVQWTNGYPGGWQIMVPNAGPERMHDGVKQGYHGEASLAQWQVTEQSSSKAYLTTTLLTAPLRIDRTVEVTDRELIVTDTITNLAPAPISSRVGQHPAFGTPFLDADSYFVTPANTLIADAQAPGTLAKQDQVGTPNTILTPGPVPQSVKIPGPGTRQALFGALTDYPGDQAWAQFISPTHGFGIQLSWDTAVFPHSWLWFEANEGVGFPWFQRMYAIATEPANVLPGEGETTDGRLRGGMGVTIEANGELVSTIRISRVDAV